jgi:hypothetical protein
MDEDAVRREEARIARALSGRRPSFVFDRKSVKLAESPKEEPKKETKIIPRTDSEEQRKLIAIAEERERQRQREQKGSLYKK